MAANVFLIDAQGDLQPLERAEFLVEAQLDRYIESYPTLLANALSTDENELRFLLVETQSAIDEAESSSLGRWAADALFLDQHGVLTIAEDKLCANPEIRRKVVGQMIEYAANLLITLTVDGLRQRLAQSHNDTDAPILQLLGIAEGEEDAELSKFWSKVETNLLAGRLRLVFVADRLPSELRRSIEFLSQYMSPVEVRGVEINRLSDRSPSKTEVLVTTTIGMTERRSANPGRSTIIAKDIVSNETFLEAFGRISDTSAEATAAREVVEALARSPAILMECRQMRSGGFSCAFCRKSDGKRLLHANASPHAGKVQFNLGKKKNLARILAELSGYELPIGDNSNQWCAQSPSNANAFIEWIQDAAVVKL